MRGDSLMRASFVDMLTVAFERMTRFAVDKGFRALRAHALLTLGLTAALIGASADVEAQTGERKVYMLGTATAGGTSHPVGVTLSALIKLKLLPNVSIDLDVINTQGSAENIELLRQNEVQFGILTSLDAYYSWTGTGPVTERGPDRKLRALTSLWRSTQHFVVRKEFVENGTLRDFANLRGRRVSLGRSTSGTRVKHKVLFANLGIDIEKEFILEDLGYSASAKAFIAGEIDGMGLSAGVPVSALVTTLEELGDDAVLLSVTDEELATADGGLDLWSREIVPAGSYPGQTVDVPTIASNNILAVSSDVPEDEVYEITKTIFENLPFLHQMHPGTKGIKLEGALAGLPMPVHAGSLRYYKEVGVAVPLLTAAADGEIAGEAFLTRFSKPAGGARAAQRRRGRHSRRARQPDLRPHDQRTRRPSRRTRCSRDRHEQQGIRAEHRRRPVFEGRRRCFGAARRAQLCRSRKCLSGDTQQDRLRCRAVPRGNPHRRQKGLFEPRCAERAKSQYRIPWQRFGADIGNPV